MSRAPGTCMAPFMGAMLHHRVMHGGAQRLGHAQRVKAVQQHGRGIYGDGEFTPSPAMMVQRGHGQQRFVRCRTG